jgi:hypothetical protein
VGRQQSAHYLEVGTLILIPVTSEMPDPPSPVRPLIAPTAANGLRQISEAMTALPIAVRRARILQHVGTLDARDLAPVEQALPLILGIEGRTT